MPGSESRCWIFPEDYDYDDEDWKDDDCDYDWDDNWIDQDY